MRCGVPGRDDHAAPHRMSGSRRRCDVAEDRGRARFRPAAGPHDVESGRVAAAGPGTGPGEGRGEGPARSDPAAGRAARHAPRAVTVAGRLVTRRCPGLAGRPGCPAPSIATGQAAGVHRSEHRPLPRGRGSARALRGGSPHRSPLRGLEPVVGLPAGAGWSGSTAGAGGGSDGSRCTIPGRSERSGALRPGPEGRGSGSWAGWRAEPDR